MDKRNVINFFNEIRTGAWTWNTASVSRSLHKAFPDPHFSVLLATALNTLMLPLFRVAILIRFKIPGRRLQTN